MRRWTAGATLMLLTGVHGASAQVYLRGQGDPLSAEVKGVEAGGVVVKAGEGSKTIGWDRVREVRGEHGAAAAAHSALSETLWRARTRLERGDFGAAEPLFEKLADQVRGAPGPTASIALEGLLRCRLRRGAQAGAAWAWLDWVHARGGAIGGLSDPADQWIGGRVEGSAVIEGATGLVTSMPPVFLRDAALDASTTSAEWSRFAGTDATTAELAMLYRAAAQFEVGGVVELAPPALKNESVRLVADVVLARTGDDAQRQAARAALRLRLDAKDIEPWLECWCRVGIGRSLLREADPDQRRQGIVQLLHAPARFVRVSSNVAAIALAEAAIALHELGDETGALAVKAELLERFGRSSAAGWSRLREIRPPAEAAPLGKPAQGGESTSNEPQGN